MKNNRKHYKIQIDHHLFWNMALFQLFTMFWQFTDCLSLYQAKVVANAPYQLSIQGPPGPTLTPTAYCDMENGGWTVIQRRVDDTVDFYRDWIEYERGFGDPNGNFWLGLKSIHLLTLQSAELMVTIENFNGEVFKALYAFFSVGSAMTNYQLLVSGFSGTAADSLSYHNNMPFSTRDQDHDKNNRNCATTHHGAWWYNSCHHSNLNGR